MRPSSVAAGSRSSSRHGRRMLACEPGAQLVAELEMLRRELQVHGVSFETGRANAARGRGANLLRKPPVGSRRSVERHASSAEKRIVLALHALEHDVGAARAQHPFEPMIAVLAHEHPGLR